MKIVAASLNVIDDYGKYVRECYQDGIEHYAYAVNEPQIYLQMLIDNALGHNLPEGYVPATTYFCISNNRILGAARLRHGTNDYIENVIGHIGYETRPSERGHGVAKYLLSWIKSTKLTENVIITCVDNNLASQAIIEVCGGNYLSSYYDSTANELKLRYMLLCA